MTTEHTVVSFRKIKKKSVQFSERLLANHRDICLHLPLVLSDPSNMCIWAFTVVADGVRFNRLCDFISAGFLLC
jgi:hypothetical protein